MIDDELKKYVESLLKQGYDLKSIRESLIKAGHDISKVEHISLFVFELFHKDLINYIDARVENGHTVDDIKKDLLKLGHSETKLKEVLDYHKQKKPKMHFTRIGDIIDPEKLWVRHYTLTYLAIFLIVISALIILSVLVSKNSSPKIEIDNMLDGCNSIKQFTGEEDYYAPLCFSLVSKNDKLCAESGSEYATECIDLFYMYTYYMNGDKENCQKISNINMRELCQQVNENACNNYFGYEGYCTAMLTHDTSVCKERSEKDKSLEDCSDNLKLYNALSGNDASICKEIKNHAISSICQTVTLN